MPQEPAEGAATVDLVPSVRFTGCGESVCLPPRTREVRLRVPLRLEVWIDGRGDVVRALTVTGGDIAPEEFLRRMRQVD